MSDRLSTTRWRDEPIIPSEWNVATMVPLARRVRNRLVEFDWYFEPEDIQRLRRAVYEWGRRVTGRYRLFDARVLHAINDALGDEHSGFRLREPKRGGGIDCSVSCARDGDGFRLKGHAPFDVVFCYGREGIESSPWMRSLGSVAGSTLARAVGMLGWDVQRLSSKEFRPVMNVLTGFPPGHGEVNFVHPGPAVDLPIHFHGPFSATDDVGCRCLFGDDLAKRGGVYLWTVEVDGEHRPWYVGQTRIGFGTRMAQHLAAMLSGQYAVEDAEALARGEHRRVVSGPEGRWPATLPSILSNYTNLVPHIIGTIRLVRFHLVPLVGDAHQHNRVEGALGRHFGCHPDERIRDFFPKVKVPAAIPGDQPLRLVLTSDVLIAGLTSELRG